MYTHIIEYVFIYIKYFLSVKQLTTKANYTTGVPTEMFAVLEIGWVDGMLLCSGATGIGFINVAYLC